MDVNCGRNGLFRKSACDITEWPRSISSRQTYNFRVDYARRSDIREVNFRRNRREPYIIEHIPTEIFRTFSNLKTFRMSTNLTELNGNDFVYAFELRTLDLSGNNIETIRSDVFSVDPRRTMSGAPLRQLEILNLNDDDIATIDDYSFHGLPQLLYLYLAYNQLTVIRQHTFDGLTSLNHLDLSRNTITTIEEDAFVMPALETLNLNGNRLRVLSDTVFKHLQHLETIDLHDNDLERVGKSLNGLSSVKTLLLQWNPIQDLDLVAIAMLPKLNVLDLSRTDFQLTSVHFDERRRWNSPLATLKFNANGLTNAADLQKLRIFPHLEELELNENAFIDFDVGGSQTLHDFLPTLNELYLRDLNTDCARVIQLERELERKRINIDVIHDCGEN